MVRTRFAPSPTGYLHIGGARTALFSWAYARHHGGKFILRIEDTDVERSTEQSVQAILDGMSWLNLEWDEGPVYQMQRRQRYQDAVEMLLRSGHAYHCYCSKEELDAMRDAQRARGEKPRYDGRWRDSKQTPPPGVKPVVRFKNPLSGIVAWDDEVKGPIAIDNAELDDMVIMRSDGVPTYNFGVVIDDSDMNITHVIRGDDHVNNTPRQINIYRALSATLPKFGHVPMILGADGERLSKRHGAVSVMQYRDDGFLPEALINYLARLGWSHGDDEIFSRQQMVDWFDLGHISRSPARFDPEKLKWLNAQYMKASGNETLATAAEPFFKAAGYDLAQTSLSSVVGLLKERASTMHELVDAAAYFYRDVAPDEAVKNEHYSGEIKPALADLRDKFTTVEWNRTAIAATIKAVLGEHKLKMPKLAMPLRAMVSGGTHTPSIDATLEVLGRDRVLARMDTQLRSFP